MARRPAQFGTAKVKERDAGRPLLVILLLVAVGIAVFLWLLPDSSDTTVTGPVEEPEPTVAAEPAAQPTRDQGPGVDEWWNRVEGTVYDAFRAAENGDCSGLEYAAEDLARQADRPEPAVAAAYDGLVSNFERAAQVCESQPEMLPGAITSASQRLRSLVQAGRGYDMEPSSLLDDYL